jgi:hypothetical protein
VLRDDEVPSVVVRYILNNPVRAGIAQNVGEYPFVGSGIYPLQDLLDFVQSSV